MMHAMARRRMLVALFSFALALVGCGDSGGAPDGSVDADASATDAPSCTDCEPIAFGVEVAAPGGAPAVVIEDGALVPWVWGPQGGTMIQPLVVLDPSHAAEGEMIDVVLTHTADPAAPDLLGQVVDFPELRDRVAAYAEPTGRLVAGPFDDQLGWDALDGTRLTLSVQVSSSTFPVSVMSAAVELAPMPVNLACEPFAVVGGAGGGCTYRALPGVATVEVVETADPGDYNCMDASHVILSFAPTDASAAEACAATLPTGLEAFDAPQSYRTRAGANPPTSCLAGLGIAPAATLPADLWVIERGTCPPWRLELGVDTTPCDVACMLP